MMLVFGKTGQIASEFIAYEDVMLLSREDADLSNPLSCENAILKHNPTAVINCAAYTAVDRAETEETIVKQINTEAPAAMARACAYLQIPLVHISTDYVFDGSGETPWKTSDHTNPKNLYGKYKLQGEKEIEASGCVHAILRTSWVISKHGNNFLKTMLRLSKSNDVLSVVDDQIGGPTCANDIAKTCVLIAQALVKYPEKTGVYHYAGQPDVSWYQFAKVIFEKLGVSTSVQPIPTSSYLTLASRPLNSRMDCSDIEKVFGITRPNWDEGIAKILDELEQIND